MCAGKKPRAMACSDNVLHPQFEQYCKYLDATNEKRERLVKASRDLTYHSKKVIFLIHRSDASNKEATLKQADKDLESVRKTHVQRIASELQGLDHWKFRKSYSCGVQEFTEAATVVQYSRAGTLLTLDELNEYLAPVKDADGASFTVSTADYLLGVADLTGEVMRLAISGAAAGDQATAFAAAEFVRALFEGFSTLPPHSEVDRDMGRKMEVMRASLTKIESACYMLHIRGSEYPPSLVALEPPPAVGCEGD